MAGATQSDSVYYFPKSDIAATAIASRAIDCGAARGMYYANAIADEIARPPPDWLVMTRDYASQSADTAALEPDNANGWYDADRQELHLVVATQ